MQEMPMVLQERTQQQVLQKTTDQATYGHHLHAEEEEITTNANNMIL